MVTLKNVLEKAKKCTVYADTAMYDKKGKFRMLTNDASFLLSNSYLLSIKKGFIWDENSIPLIGQIVFPKSGIYAIPALIHDALYYKTELNRSFADKKFQIWMEALMISNFQKKMRYKIVKLLGGILAWNKNIKNPSKRTLHNRQLITLTKQNNLFQK